MTWHNDEFYTPGNLNTGNTTKSIQSQYNERL